MAFGDFGRNENESQKKLNAISNHFYHSGKNLSCGSELTPPYRTRLLLPILIGVASLFKPWWAVCIPSILIYFAIGFLYAKFVSKLKPKANLGTQLFLLIPFLSPHIGWFLANIMTEGPLLLILLLMLNILVRSPMKATKSELPIFLLLGNAALFTKQSWPMVAVMFYTYFEKRKFFSKTVAAILSVLGCFTASELVKIVGSSIYGSDFGNWNDFSLFAHPLRALKGVELGLSHDLFNLAKFGDVFGFIGIGFSLYLLLFGKLTATNRLILATSFLWGLATVGTAYIADGSFGQNWRFFVFATFLAFPMWFNQKLSSSSLVEN